SPIGWPSTSWRAARGAPTATVMSGTLYSRSRALNTPAPPRASAVAVRRRHAPRTGTARARAAPLLAGVHARFEARPDHEEARHQDADLVQQIDRHGQQRLADDVGRGQEHADHEGAEEDVRARLA